MPDMQNGPKKTAATSTITSDPVVLAIPSLRAYFAGQALAGILASFRDDESRSLAIRVAEDLRVHPKVGVAKACCAYADRLLAELAREPAPLDEPGTGD